MMKIQQRIEEKLKIAFMPIYLEVINESNMHHVPEGSESHFKVIVVSEHFIGERLLTRHRSVNHTLKDELARDIHALAIHTYTPSEWQERQQSSPDSPSCRDGYRY